MASLVGASLASALALAGCNKPSQEEAEKTEREANERAEKARLDAAEKISEAQRDAEKAANDAAKARGETRGELQKDVDAVDRKISYLKERAVEVKGSAKNNADVAQAEAEKRRSTLRDDFRKLQTDTGAEWDSAKAAVEHDLKSLKESLDSWETTVADKPAH
ncbi:MAG: hypothetical protein ABUL60_11700 [Myxococcales bacterium]